MRLLAPLRLTLSLLSVTLVAACAVADEPPQIEPDATSCASIITCGCTPGVTYTCPSGQIVTCQDGGTWPEEPCNAGEAGVDATVGDATTDAADSSSHVSEAAADVAAD
jgi:hypothetical protein